MADDIVERLGRTKFMQEADVEALCDEAAVEIKRLRAERNDCRNTLAAIYALAVQVMGQHPSHATAWIDTQHMTVEAWQEKRQAHKEARK